MQVPYKPHELIIWRLRRLQPGEIFVYHIGFLESDRLSDPDGSLNRIANTAYDLMSDGSIILTQKRISSPMTKEGRLDWKSGSGAGFQYIATGAKPKQKKLFDLFMGASS